MEIAKGPAALRAALTPVEMRATRELIRQVRREVPARLDQASLFGSKARGEARPDSDVDVLLIFAHLPPDREPHATHAEEIAERVARRTGVPVTVWSVSRVDLGLGNRTPMLVDALEDGLPLWYRDRPVPALSFTPADAVRCVRALLDRVAEGDTELRGRLDRGDLAGAELRARDDLVRMCTASLLIRGITRPRHGEAVRRYLETEAFPPPAWTLPLLRWAERSYGVSGKDEEAPVPPPPGGVGAAARAVEELRGRVRRRLRRLAAAGSFAPPGAYRAGNTICAVPGVSQPRRNAVEDRS